MAMGMPVSYRNILRAAVDWLTLDTITAGTITKTVSGNGGHGAILNR
jgi:hypothetical protein